MKQKKKPSGQGLSEYMILVMLIAVGSIAAAKTVGGTIQTKLKKINTSLKAVNSPRAKETPAPEDENEEQESNGLFSQIFGHGR